MKTISTRISLPLLLLTFLLVLPSGVGAPLQLLPSYRAAADLIQAVNSLRDSKGFELYQTDTILMSVAQTQADYIAGTGVLTHYDENGKRPYQRAIDAGYPVAGDLSFGGLFSEAIYSGTGLSFDDVIGAWQSNPSDEKTLLSADYRDIGVGIAAANGVTYYVLVAGSKVESTTGTVETTLSPNATDGTPVELSTPLANGDVYHVVQKNEALWSIALAYDTTIEELKQLNHLSSDEIFEGQKLLIRSAATETVTPSPAPVTATLGIPTSTATQPIPPTHTPTATPAPKAPASLQSGGMAVGVIVIAALFIAGIGAFISGKKSAAKKKEDEDS